MLQTITCKTNNNSYPITIARGAFEEAGLLIRKVNGGSRAMILSDSHVAPLYLSSLISSLEAENYTVSSHVFTAGEEQKRLSTVTGFYEALTAANITRTDCIIALGGGVTGDMAGFAAATFLRGTPYIQIPTSLLAMVDSSVGGKTGVDIEAGKNLVGAIYQPKAVIVDPNLLQTLPKSDFADGMAEVIKYGAILDEDLFFLLQSEKLSAESEGLTSVIATCISSKCKVVEEDELDLGKRAILNFGHTLGHAAEKLANYTGLTHGKAISGGMVIAAKLGEKLGLTENGTLEKLSFLLQTYHLPTSLSYSASDLTSAAKNDKKNLQGKLNFVLLSKIGTALLYPIQFDQLELLLDRLNHE